VLGAAFVMITLAIGTLFSLAVFLNHPRRAGLLPSGFSWGREPSRLWPSCWR